MNTQELLQLVPDETQSDHFATSPASPRFIFFDDPRPSKEELRQRNEAIDEEEQASLQRPWKRGVKRPMTKLEYQTVHPEQAHVVGKDGIERPTVPQRRLMPVTKDDIDFIGHDYIDPELDRYAERLEQRRFEIWLSSWYARNRPDQREKLLGDMVALELSEQSYLTKIRQGLAGEMSASELENLWAKLSIYKAVKDILKKPQIQVIHKRTPVLKFRMLTTHRKVMDDYGNLVEFDYTEAVGYLAHQEERIVDADGDLCGWRDIHQALNGHGDVGSVPRPPRRTLFSNPNGRRILNDTARTRSPIQAKMAFARNHKLEPERVMVERVVMESWNKDWLRQHKLSNPGKSLYVVSARKLSNESASTYYDPDPTFQDRVDREGDWCHEYQWTSGRLLKVPADKVIPNGAYRLTVRDLERAILAGAEFAEDEDDLFAMTYEDIEHSADERIKGEQFPLRPVEQMSEAEQMFYDTLNGMGLFSFSEMMLIDFKNLPFEDQSLVDSVASILFNTFAPVRERDLELEQALGTWPIEVQTNPYWSDIEEAVSPEQAFLIERFLLDLCSETPDDAEAPATPSPGDSCHSVSSEADA